MSDGYLDIRPRYSECDPMGVVHHTVYPIWFEMGRTEHLRTSGTSYRDLEEQGVRLVVVKLEVRYRQPARYDDELQLQTKIESIGHVKIEHSYELLRGSEVLVLGRTTLACVDEEGRAIHIPDALLAL